jgi:hypothetical protein
MGALLVPVNWATARASRAPWGDLLAAGAEFYEYLPMIVMAMCWSPIAGGKKSPACAGRKVPIRPDIDSFESFAFDAFKAFF